MASTFDDPPQGMIDRLCAASVDVHRAKGLALAFLAMVRGRQVEKLDGWLSEAGRSQLPELESFAESLAQDRGAVEAALRYEWSNGPVEGHVNRLKLVKRQMFGRAKLDLLKARVQKVA